MSNFPWGVEAPLPADADTADHVTVEYTWGVKVFDDNEWRWSCINAPEQWYADDHAVNYVGAHEPVPVHRRVVEVKRVYYSWGWPIAAGSRVEVHEVHTVLSEHTYAGLPNPVDELDRR